MVNTLSHVEIRLYDLKDELSIPGKDLLTRPMADKFVQLVVSKIEETKDTSVAIEFNFGNIGTADTSFIDQLIIVKLPDEMKRRRLPPYGVYLSHLSASTNDNAYSVFGEKGIPILVQKQIGDWDLLGKLETNLASALQLLMKRKEITAVDLKKQMRLEINAASTKLNRLYKMRLATRREEISKRGRMYIYRSVF